MSTKLALVGEAYGEHEERERMPFVGATGYELNRMLDEAGIVRADCFLTNVFNLRPPSNKIEAFCGPKEESLNGYPALVKGKYVRAEFQPELTRLADEIEDVNPNLILALGNTAMWAMLGKTTISKLRGTTSYSSHTISGYKVLPTYHPAAIFRQFELRPIAIIDLMKAAREQHYPEIRRPKRSVWIEPSLEDIYEFKWRYIDKSRLLAVDIETAGTQITCIGYAPSRSLSIVIPFFDPRKPGRSYWPDKQSEGEAWRICSDILEDRRISKVFQNGMYDIAFLWRAYGIKVMGANEDTMLLHHALQPESLKGLGFLGSIYCDLPAWKTAKTTETIKRDD